MMRRNAVVSYNSFVPDKSVEKKCPEPCSRRGGVVLSEVSIKETLHDQEPCEEMQYESKQHTASINSSAPSRRVLHGKLEHSKESNKKNELSTLSKHQNEVANLPNIYIIIDKQLGFNIDHEGNALFLAILDAYYTDMYAEAMSQIHRGIILNMAIDDMCSRGFKFVLRSRGKHFRLEDDIVILKQIKSLLKQRIS